MGYETPNEIWKLVKKAQTESINSNSRLKTIENLISYILNSRLFCRFRCPPISASESSFYENKPTPNDIYNQAQIVYKNLLQEVEKELKKRLTKSFNDNSQTDYLEERLNKSLNDDYETDYLEERLNKIFYDNSKADYLPEIFNNIRDKIFADILQKGGLNLIAKQAKEAKILQLYLREKSEQCHHSKIQIIKEERKKADNLLQYTINELYQAILLSDETNINKWKRISNNSEIYTNENDAYDIGFKETTIFICNNIHKYNEGNDNKSFIKWFSFKLGFEKKGAYQEINKKVDIIYDLDDLDKEIQVYLKQEKSDNPTYFSDKKYFTSPENKTQNKGIDFLQLASLRLKNSNWEEITKEINDLSGLKIKKDTYKKLFSQWLQEWVKKWNDSEEANRLGKIKLLESQQIMSLTDLEKFVGKDEDSQYENSISSTIESNFSEIDNGEDFDYSSFFSPDDMDEVNDIMNKKIKSVNFKMIFKDNAEGYSLKEISEKYGLNYNTCRAFFNKNVKRLKKLKS